MNRPGFLGALGAAVATVLVGVLPTSAAVPKGVAVSAPVAAELSLWEFSGLGAWVVASSADEARALVQTEYGIAPSEMERFGEVRRMDDNEHFTMTYDDGTPDGLEPDVACKCEPQDLEESGCMCEASTPRVTLNAESWCKHFEPGEVIGEYQG